jgi:hypothetical protein
MTRHSEDQDQTMRRFIGLSIFTLLSLGCSDADAAPDRAAEAVVTGQELPTVLVYKTPACGCCNGWVEHMRAAGFTVDTRDVNDIMSVKQDGGVPVSMSSCHTSLVDGYVVEGHVPADQVRRLLAERPEIAGIAAPGMPSGSPGMEGPNAQPYEILSFTRSGEAAVFAEVDPR